MDVEHLHQGIPFEWDSVKAAANLAKHHVSFVTACEVFLDPFVYLADEEAVSGEIRETVIGMTRRWSTLCVVYTVRVDNRYRIISARPATAAERRCYEQQ
jgi:uncharacterized protein